MSDERRLVTVLFADVAGSTHLAEDVDPERLRDHLRRYYEIAKDATEGRGGSVEKFIGDAVVAVFGLRQAHGNDAERALATALEIRDRIRDDPKLSRLLTLRFGVTTGEVMATRDNAARDFMVTGDAVNTAARLQQAAQPWEVLVSERTARSTPEFELGPAAILSVKGRTAPVAARPLIGRRKRSVAPTRLPLSGRTEELGLLRQIAKESIELREPRIVTITGAAGTGKTRLMEDFLAWLPKHLPPDATVVRVLPTGRDATFGLPRQMLSQIIGSSEDLGPVALNDRARIRLAELGVEQADRVTESLLATTDSGTDSADTPDVRFAVWRQLVEAAARQAPLVLLFEDLHDASESALDLLESAIQIAPPAVLLVIALARPELHKRRPEWPRTQLPTTRLALEPLSDRAIEELVWRRAGIDSPAMTQAIVKRSQGNPYFATELAIAARDRGQLEPTSQFEAADEIPDTVQATVLNRLDQLNEPERRMLQVSSIFGRVFSLEEVKAVDSSLLEPTAVAKRLIADQLVRRSGAKHLVVDDLVSRVAYRLLSRKERQRLHIAAAQWIETEHHPGPSSEMIAGHYREAALIAIDLDPDSAETEQLRGLAIDRLLEAARRLGATALPEGLAHIQAAADLRRR